MVGISQYVVTKNLEGAIAIRRAPHEMAGWNLEGCPDYRLEDLIEGFEKA